MTIILDLGGVLMQHNMPECMARFRAILGEENMTRILGLKANAEGVANSLMEQFELGEITTEQFIHTILIHARPCTTAQQVIDAWNAMHAGIPQERLTMIQQWKNQGHQLIMLSNNNELHWNDVNQRYDLSMFDHRFASHLLHCSKPSRQIYEIVHNFLIQHNYPEPYYFVDDLDVNRYISESFGWISYPSIEALNICLE